MTRYPEIAKEWDYSKNAFVVRDVDIVHIIQFYRESMIWRM